MRTRNAASILLFGIFLSFLGCKKDESAPGFDMLYQQEFVIPPGIGLVAIHLRQFLRVVRGDIFGRVFAGI